MPSARCFVDAGGLMCIRIHVQKYADTSPSCTRFRLSPTAANLLQEREQLVQVRGQELWRCDEMHRSTSTQPMRL